MATKKPSMDVYYSQGGPEYQKQLAMYNYEQGDLNAEFGGYRVADIYKPGTGAYAQFNPAGSFNAPDVSTRIEEVKSIFKNTTGKDLIGDGLNTITGHIQQGESVQQALSNLGDLKNMVRLHPDYVAQNNLVSNQVIPQATIAATAPRYGGSDQITVTSPTGETRTIQGSQAPGFEKSGWKVSGVVGQSVAQSAQSPSRLSTPEFAAQFQQRNGRAPTQGELMNYVNTGTFPSSVTPEGMQPQPGITLPSPSPADTSAGPAMVAGANSSIAEVMKSLTPPETPEQQKEQSLLDQMASLTGQQAQRAADQLTAEQSSQLPQLRQQFADINAQILSKTAEYNVLQTANENKPITMNSIIGNDRAIQNARAADIGLLQARALGLQGQIETAQNTVNRAIDLKYQTVDAQLNTYQAQLQALEPTLNKQEKRRAEALQIMLDNQKQALSEKKDEERNIQNLMLEAASKGASSAILSSISGSSTLAQAAQAYSKFFNQPINLPSNTRTSGPTSGPVQPVSTGNLSLRAQAVMKNRELLKTYTPSEASKIQDELINAGVDLSALPIEPVLNKEAQAFAQQQLDLASAVLTSSGLSGAVGPSAIARFRPIASLTGSTANFIGSVEQLTNQQTLKILTDLKKAGGTLGALSEKELVLLQDAATKINNWAKRDSTGKVYAYQASEADFREEVKRIQKLAQKAVNEASGPVSGIPYNGIAIPDGSAIGSTYSGINLPN